ncbi:hypothetical protein NDU88_006188 [Pleurodeles waltl]|uniref:Uncharacterized protein n=1 Tax=Pleurodeles waltl TaxID=8319 RepID=A0AAV7PL30_PLEWA|nr:hypothetical protein NDU88_006188 [Pleurodeles waltl]
MGSPGTIAERVALCDARQGFNINKAGTFTEAGHCAFKMPCEVGGGMATHVFSIRNDQTWEVGQACTTLWALSSGCVGLRKPGGECRQQQDTRHKLSEPRHGTSGRLIYDQLVEWPTLVTSAMY